MADVEMTAINIEHGNCLKIAVPSTAYSLLIDNGRVPSEVELPEDPCRYPAPGLPPIDPEQTVFGRLKPYFGRDEQVHQFLSHCHLDHIGGLRALRYLSDELGFKTNTYMTRFAAEVAASRDFYQLPKQMGARSEFFQTGYYTQVPGRAISVGEDFRVIAHQVCHSTPTSHIFEIETPAGPIVWLMDFTFGRYSEQQRQQTADMLQRIGQKRPRVAFVEALYSSRPDPDFTPLETRVWECFENILRQAQGLGKRVIIAQFGSNVDRSMATLALAERLDISTRLMGAPWMYLQAAQLAKVEFQKGWSPTRPFYDNIPPEDSELLIVSGCQAEPFAVLPRSVGLDSDDEAATGMVYTPSKYGLDLGPDDIIVLSSTPIPCNWNRVIKMISLILARGCQVILPNELASRREFHFSNHPNCRNVSFEQTHVSGHEGWFGIRTALELLRPEYVVPFHGDATQRSQLAQNITQELPDIRIQMIEEGETISLPTS